MSTPTKSVEQNTKIAQMAMKVAEEHETKQGRTPKPVSSKRLGYDIESGDRKIEVKGTSWTWIRTNQVSNISQKMNALMPHTYTLSVMFTKNLNYIFLR